MHSLITGRDRDEVDRLASDLCAFAVTLFEGDGDGAWLVRRKVCSVLGQAVFRALLDVDSTAAASRDYLIGLASGMGAMICESPDAAIDAATDDLEAGFLEGVRLMRVFLKPPTESRQ